MACLGLKIVTLLAAAQCFEDENLLRINYTWIKTNLIGCTIVNTLVSFVYY